MERQFDRCSMAARHLSDALKEFEESQPALEELSEYYDGEAWKQDFTDDERGVLPENLKRGILSEDAIWNLLDEINHLKDRMAELSHITPKQFT